jgi:hypothetical protein
MKMRIRVARPPTWLIGLIVLAAALGAFMAADRLMLHWYVPDTAQLERTLNTSDYYEWGQRKAAVDRLSNAVSILSLVQAYGGQQSSASPAGKACVAWLDSGIGSITDCGFQHVQQ